MAEKKHIKLEDLEIYQIACEISDVAWEIYVGLDWRMKKINGDQFIRSADSIGGNIAEAYGRFHYLDRIRFCYFARGSLLENLHWVKLMLKRKIGNQEFLKRLVQLLKKEEIKLNNYISSIYRSKKTS